MKPLFAFCISVALLIALSSCKKDWVCNCTYTGGAGTSIFQFQILHTTRDAANANCNNHADSLSANQGVAEVWTCALD